MIHLMGERRIRRRSPGAALGIRRRDRCRPQQASRSARRQWTTTCFRKERSDMAQSVLLQRLSHLPHEPNPALVAHAEERAQSVQNRIADQITAFAGSMWFVYIHIIWFSCWIGLGVEKYPYGLLTMIVSLEAIFLSTFVMISQNRADAKRQVIADQQWQTVKEEDRQNEELLDLSRQILDLTKAIHAVTSTPPAAK
jgi:uncharacterized membrane protein